LVYVALPAAVLLAFFANPSREIEFFRMLFAGELNSENNVYLFTRAITVMRYGKYWWVAIIAFLFLVLTISMLIVKINRHMHVGEMSALPFKQTFRLFPFALTVFACFFGISEIAMLLSVGIMYILRSVGSALAVSLIGVGVSFVLRLLSAWIFMLLIIALPLKFSENYHLNVALSYSVRMMSKQGKLTWGLSCAYVFGRYAVMGLGYLLSPYKLDILLYALVYLFIIMLMPSLAYRLYHDVIGGERRDITQIIFD